MKPMRSDRRMLIGEAERSSRRWPLVALAVALLLLPLRCAFGQIVADPWRVARVFRWSPPPRRLPPVHPQLVGAVWTRHPGSAPLLHRVFAHGHVRVWVAVRLGGRWRWRHWFDARYPAGVLQPGDYQGWFDGRGVAYCAATGYGPRIIDERRYRPMTAPFVRHWPLIQAAYADPPPSSAP